MTTEPIQDYFFLEANQPGQAPTVPTMNCGLYACGAAKRKVDRQHERLERLVQLSQKQFDARWVIAGHYGDVLRTRSESVPPDLARLLLDIEEGRVNCIVIRSVEHITQFFDHHWLLINQLEANGVSVICEDYPTFA